MTKHTPAPWTVDMADDGIDQRPCVLGGKNNTQPVADILGPLDDEDGPHRGYYDLQLILAAPDLLALLEDAYDALPHGDLTTRIALALAKAKGE